MKASEFVKEDMSRRDLLKGMALAGGAAAMGSMMPNLAQAKVNTSPAPLNVPQDVADNPRVALLLKWARKWIKDPNELAAFMAQCAHESDNFRTLDEYGSPERFAQKYDIRFNPQKAKQLGNDKPGDGAKYHGRGYIQLTGKYNYQKASEWISEYIGKTVDFVRQPDLVATPTAAALSSIWYWMTFVHPKTKNFSNTGQVTKHINPGMHGQKNREQKAKVWRSAFNAPDIKVASR